MAHAVFLPWQTALAQRWLAQQERFAHAWLIHGQAGIGKRQFARAAAQSLLCETPRAGLACGECQSCRWVASGNHPDLRLLRPQALAIEEGDGDDGGDGQDGKTPSREIRVDALRALTPWFNTRTHKRGWRVLVLYPAEALNVISANTVLKILEEPPAATVFLLVSDTPDRLLPTLLSRCRRLPLGLPDRAHSLAWLQAEGVDDAEAWLAAASGAPLRARVLHDTMDAACPPWLGDLLDEAGHQSANPQVGSIADHLAKTPAIEWLDTLQRLFMDVALNQHGAAARYFPAMRDRVHAVAAHADALRVLEALRWLGQQKAVAMHPLNERLLLHQALQRAALALRAPAARRQPA